MNNDKEPQCGVAVGLNVKEKDLFIALAREIDVPYYLVMRRLVRYILDGKISWMDLFKKSNELIDDDEYDGAEKSFMRTQLSQARCTAFSQLAEEWGSTTSIVLRRLILLYIAGEIERNAIWY